MAALHAREYVYFSPDDNIAQQLITFIDNEQRSIQMAAYCFTHRGIASALIKAHKRGVLVELVVDTFALESAVMVDIIKAEIPIYIFDPLCCIDQSPRPIKNKKKQPQAALMHNKCIIFSCNIEHRPWVWTGSFNFTYQANDRNQENCVIVDAPAVIDRFRGQFEILKQRCMLYERYIEPSAEFKRDSYWGNITQWVTEVFTW